MCNYQREKADRHAKGAKCSVQRDARNDARQRDGQDHEEADRLSAKETKPLHGEGGHRAKHQCDERSNQRGLQ